MKTKIFRQTARLLLLGLGLTPALLCSCGKSGFPRPPANNAEFTWVSVEGQAAGSNCLFIQGTLDGAVQHLNDVIIEIEPVTQDSCLQCPFSPKEKEHFSAWRLGISSSNHSFSKTYCPKFTGDGARWRLVGTNTHNNLPNAVSQEAVTAFTGKTLNYLQSEGEKEMNKNLENSGH